jgi:kynurenine formamidase
VKATVDVFGGPHRADLAAGYDISLPVVFDGDSSRAFHLPAAAREAVQIGTFVGSVEQGGSVNCEILHLAPHGNGTHTECVGHVVSDGVNVTDVAPTAVLPAVLISVVPVRLGDTAEGYGGKHEADDAVITKDALVAAHPDTARAGEALVVRVRGGAPAGASFTGTNPPYFTRDAMMWLVDNGVGHLLTDLPSIDREDDGGLLANHRRLWGLSRGQVSLEGSPPSPRTVTELCRVADEVTDGRYLLSLHVAPLESDAAPSRPVLYPLEPVS